MASEDFSAALPVQAHPMAPSGYGKRLATAEDSRRKGTFGHLPEREAYLAAYIDRLTEGAAIDCKTPAKEQPRYGQAAVRSALNALSDAGHLRRFRERSEGVSQWVTYTYFSRTARDNAWWRRFRAGEAMEEEPVKKAVNRAAESATSASVPPTLRAAARPGRSKAYAALAAVGAADPRMMLSAADCEALEALAQEWVARGASQELLVRELTFRLPEEVGCPREFARRRLVDRVPPERPDARRELVMVCVGCDVEGSPEELPGGLCRRCRDEMQREAGPAVPPEEVRSRVGQLRRSARVPEGSGT